MLFGEIMGETERASRLVDYYRKNFDLVRDRLADVSGPRPKVYMEFSGDKSVPAVFGPTWGKKMWGGIVENCRGDNIARDLVVGASGQISPEKILAADPDLFSDVDPRETLNDFYRRFFPIEPSGVFMIRLGE